MPVHFGRQRIPPEALGGALPTFVDGHRGVDTPRVFAIDSSKMQLPSQFEREGVLPRNAAAARPLAMCSTLFDTSLDVPYHAIVATHHNERQCLLEGHRQVLRAGDLVIGDRGYYSINVCRSLHDSNVDVLLRVKEKASRKLSLSHRSIRTILSRTMVLD